MGRRSVWIHDLEDVHGKRWESGKRDSRAVNVQLPNKVKHSSSKFGNQRGEIGLGQVPVQAHPKSGPGRDAKKAVAGTQV